MSRGITIVRGAALLLLIAATVYALDRWAVNPLRCGHAASLGAAALDRESPSPFQTQRLARQIRADLQDCTCVTPPDASIPMTLGAAAEASDDARGAIAEYQRALQLDRRPEIYFHLGLMQQATLNPSAIENIVRACAFDPARLADIPYDDMRKETEKRLRAMYGPGWAP
jgi:cytochrome c-type biogenesis protein CcmH/NrfG